MTPEQRLFQIQLDAASRKFRRPEELMRSSLRGIIELQLKVFKDNGLFITQSRFSPDARDSRSFEGECQRLTTAVASKITFTIMNAADAVVRKEMVVNEELKSALISKFVDFVYSEMIPTLEALPLPGDPFAVWTDSATQYQAFFKHAVELEAKYSIGPYEDLSGCLAILGLVIQARRHHTRGELEQAWLSLTDATFFAGTQQGAVTTRALQAEVVKKQRAMDSSVRSRERLTQLKLLVVELYETRKPPDGWKNATVAAHALHAEVSEMANRILGLPTRERQRRFPKRLSMTCVVHSRDRNRCWSGA